MNESDLELLSRKFPISEATRRRNQAGGSPSSAKLKQVVRDEPLGSPAREEGNTGRVHVRVVSFRKQLIDPDNLCPKFFVDCLRYAGLIRDDRQEDITLEVSQIKVASKDDERTEIEII